MSTKSISIVFLVLIFTFPSFGAQYWPTMTWKKNSPQALGFDPKSIDNMFQFVHKKKFPIDSVVIVRNGYLIGELYANGIDEKSLSNIYSVTKSFTSALVGIAIDEGHIKNERQTLGSIFSKNVVIKNDPKLKNIEIRHLLTMTSGSVSYTHLTLPTTWLV